MVRDRLVIYQTPCDGDVYFVFNPKLKLREKEWALRKKFERNCLMTLSEAQEVLETRINKFPHTIHMHKILSVEETEIVRVLNS